MALATYDDLLSAINGAGGWLHRADLATIAPDWVTLCEATMNYGDLEVSNVPGLRTADQETITTALSCSTGVQTVTLPSDFLEMRKIYLVFGTVRQELRQAPILPMRPQESANVQSMPKSYRVVGNTLYFDVFPDQNYPLVLDYYAKIPSLITSGTNWLMTQSPMAYLSGSILHGAPWLGAKFDPSPWVAQFRAAMWQVHRSDAKKRHKLTQLRSEAADLQRHPFNILTGM